MPSFSKHLLIGGVVGLTTYTASHSLKKIVTPQARFDFGKAATWTAVGALAATLPDWLEPGTSPNHRGFFHSVAVLVAIIWLLMVVPIGTLATIALWVVAALGYASHLVADSFTPRRLPWI